MIIKKKSHIIITTSMGITKSIFTEIEWEKVCLILEGLTGEELLDLQYLIKSPPKKIVISKLKKEVTK